MKLIFLLLISSTVFGQKDTTKKKIDPDPIIIFQMRTSRVPDFFKVLDNSNEPHALVKAYMESLYVQYQNQVDTTKKKK